MKSRLCLGHFCITVKYVSVVIKNIFLTCIKGGVAKYNESRFHCYVWVRRIL